jgi:hypothetical protein
LTTSCHTFQTYVRPHIASLLPTVVEVNVWLVLDANDIAPFALAPQALEAIEDILNTDKKSEQVTVQFPVEFQVPFTTRQPRHTP